ncbi:MAG TPA: Holliday junction branch migration protein RuvA [Chitinophagaceae bacterium]|nr:Holliday junction branch migration protein RuvA [Chitinophagaceae bacterium]NBY25543.1 Holliday junction branch migration protein RuvA [Chitinophagaceae bacterium]NCW87561.1 Holliday junction branch migration protein RuvA [Chitinophagia bacterium]HAL94674.1 Holliday junction branch migration protein RuvA [Chitinophagaceae bacterium]
MISFLRGQFVEKSPTWVWIDVNGVGYEVHISLHTYSTIQDKKEGLLYTILLVREDAHLLYGFAEKSERDLFQHLISVSGVGASTARVMLSYLKPEELVAAIVQSNVKALESIKGIGKKTAERLVLELKDKLSKIIPLTNNSTLINNTLQQDALNALTALGIPKQAAAQVVEKTLKANPELGVEDLVKKALRSL